MTFKNSIRFLASLLLSVTSFNSWALSEEGHKVINGSTLMHGSPEWLAAMEAEGLVALYLFEETSGPFLDTSGYRDGSGNLEPLNLVVDDPDADQPGPNIPEVDRTGSSVKIQQPVLIHSNGPASKINRECKANGELTIEAWISNENDGQLPPENPMRRIVTLSNEVQNKRGDTPVEDQLSSSNSNFFLSLVYDNTPLFKTNLRTSETEEDGILLSSDPDIVEVKKKQHIILTKDRNGVSRFFVSFYDDDGNIIDTLRNEYNNLGELRGNFDNWDDNAVLGIGNEISYRDSRQGDRMLEDGIQASTKREQNPWIGEMYMLAVYCKAKTPEMLLGDRAPGQPKYQAYTVDSDMIVTEEFRKAALLYKRLGGVSPNIANPVIADMASDIAQGNLVGAAARATESSDFFNITVRDFAARMSNREETVNVPLNDFVATVIGVTRDDINAKQLLTSDYIYQGDPTKAAVPANQITHVITSNQHYESLENGRFDLKDVLIQKPQRLYDGLGNLSQNHDAAGLLTTRAWMDAHASAGTNRRLVEFAFREFLCVPMEQWADAEAPDNYVGRDIDRFPAGDHSKYTTTCRSCHSVMDSLRGAYAYYDFSNGFVKNSFRLPASDAPAAETESGSINLWPGTNVVTKMNHNDHTFPDGHEVVDNSFKNQAVWGANAAYFGWGEQLEGAGVHQFGQMIAEAEAFPFCMAKRAFRSTCKRDPVSIDKSLLESAAQQFKDSNYNLKTLFQAVAVSKECLGEEL